MDEFLAEYYNTLGFGDMVKEAAAPGPGQILPNVRRRKRSLRGRDPGSRLPRAVSSGKKTQHEFVGYRDPIGPPPSTARDRYFAEMNRPGRRQYDKPIGPAPAMSGKTQYDKPIGPPRPPKAKPSAASEAASEAAEAAPGFLKRMGKRWKGMSRGGKAALIAAAATPVVAGGGYAAYRAMKNREKRSSDAAFDQMVEERAFDILYENGLADDYGNVIPPDEFEYEKTAGDFDSIVDEAALEMLEANGYPVEWD